MTRPALLGGASCIVLLKTGSVVDQDCRGCSKGFCRRVIEPGCLFFAGQVSLDGYGAAAGLADGLGGILCALRRTPVMDGNVYALPTQIQGYRLADPLTGAGDQGGSAPPSDTRK